MPPNNPVTPPTSPQPVAQPATPVAPTPPIQQPPQSSHKMLLWLGLGLVLIVLVIGGFYLYSIRQQAALVKQTTVAPAPVAVQENLENDLNSVNVDSTLDNDFSALDADLSQL